MNKQILSYLAIVLVVIVGYLGIVLEDSVWQPKELPYFEFSTLDEQTKITRKDLRGKIAVVNFWASWCEVCKGETPELTELHEAGIAVYGVITQDARAAASVSPALLDRPWPQIFDGNGDLLKELGFVGIPSSILLNAQGEIIERRSGAIDADFVAKALALK